MMNYLSQFESTDIKSFTFKLRHRMNYNYYYLILYCIINLEYRSQDDQYMIVLLKNITVVKSSIYGIRIIMKQLSSCEIIEHLEAHHISKTIRFLTSLSIRSQVT